MPHLCDDRPTALGPLLRSARHRAGLSQSALARAAGLSESTIKNLERGRPASLPTLRSLAAVPALDLPPDLRAGLSAALPEPGALNAWLAPGFSPLSFFRDMLAVLRGRGGLVEQACLYYDHAGAQDWAAIASHSQYDEAHRVVPLDRAAGAVVRALGPSAPSADVIALGPGDGRLETRFVGHLADLLPCPALRFYLLDISQPLLGEAYRHASEALHLHAGITPVAILGDFHCLPQYSQLSYASPLSPRRKVVVLLGGTLGNLEHEHRFLRDSLRGFPPGTLLLLDYPLCFAPADRPDEVRARDPWLSGPSGPAAAGHERIGWRERVLAFWTGPLRRYVPGCAAVEVRLELSCTTAASTVPGAYAVEAMARAKVRGEPDREFSIFRLRRYEPLGLARTLRDLGWDPLDGWPYGQDVGYPRALSLFLRRRP